jgi:hypothetical protein
MSTLRSTLDELRGEDLRVISDKELGEGLVELERSSRVIEAERCRRLVEVERRATWAVDGHLSVVSWLAVKVRVGFSRASRHVKLSRALSHMPRTASAFGEGELSSEAVGLLVGAREAAREAFGEAEEMLVDAGIALPARDLRTVVAYWCQAADAAEAAEREQRSYEGRRLHVSPTIDGVVRIDGDLDPESGQTLITALRSVQDAWARNGGDDLRTPPQRRVDALVELCRRSLDRSDRPEIAGERPHVIVTVDLETLEDQAGRRSELEDTGPITPETARRIACDAGVSRIIRAGVSEPLDVGRKTPVVPVGIRRALVLRDGGCRFPGCGRPQAWCDAHHVRHWADGGETALGNNLVLLCRPHHRAIHDRFRVEISGGGPVFSRADGIPLVEDRAPPSLASSAGPPSAVAPEQPHRYFEAESAAPTAAWPAANRAVSTRKGEQLT